MQPLAQQLDFHNLSYDGRNQPSMAPSESFKKEGPELSTRYEEDLSCDLNGSVFDNLP